MSHKWVYLFTEVDEAQQYVGGSWDGVRALLGGKGAGLADMIRGKLPVPPGFTVTTEACNAYLAAGEQFPEGLWEQELAAMKATEAATGKVFGDPSNPLLVSCRSGAKFSMPGMMDTVLNIGLNEETVAGMVALTGNEKFVYDSYRRLVQMFGSVVMDVPKDDFEKVLETYRHQAGVASDSDLSVDALGGDHRPVQADRQAGHRPGLPQRSLRSTQAGHRGGLQIVERQARLRLPQRLQDRP
jgi:pyruvate,orthophosphate dikinase